MLNYKEKILKPLKSGWSFLKAIIDKWTDDKAPKLGAAVSFYTIFSLSPILLITIAVVGFIFGKEAARGEIVEQIGGLVGNEGAQIVQTAIQNAGDTTSGIIATIISVIILIVASTGVFIELQDSLNIIWKIKPKPSRGFFRSLIMDRLISFAMVLGMGFVMLVSLVISALLSALNKFIGSYFSIPIDLLEFLNILFSFVVIFLLFSMIFKFLPDIILAWRDVWAGALVTSLLFVLGKYLIGIYLGSSSYTSTYGAAGSLVIFLMWIYYSAQILFLGAEFTYIYAVKYGSGYKPKNEFFEQISGTGYNNKEEAE